MGAATLGRPSRRAPHGAELGFERTGGPLVAVCSLVGGAGASTLALAIAYQAARASSVPILATELSPDRAGLGVTSGSPSECCLMELAMGRRPAKPFTHLTEGLRLVASKPKPRPEASDQDVVETLNGARRAHGLVVVDCGPLSTQTALALRAATLIVWVTAADRPAVDRAAALLASPNAPPVGPAPEMLVAVAPAAAGCGVRAMRRLAEGRCRALAMVEHDTVKARAAASGQSPDPYAEALSAVFRLVRD